MSSFDPDHALAIILQARFNEEAKKAKEKEKENLPNAVSKPLSKVSLIDSEWETTDPCPDIHGLFLAFNERFFWSRLMGIEVKWSAQMTSCAGICVYEGRNGLCSVRLSAPLLKLRPRSDLVETLLHEMIHAYLFVTHNNRDRDGHGPEFQKHMHRINKEAGTNITVYHSFHAEVKLYQQHWWRCDGPCQHKPPFFGMVKRARNRAPGPNDLWWAQHLAVCGGKYIKVREPEDYKKKKTAAKDRPGKDIRSFWTNPAKEKTPESTTATNTNKPGRNIFGFNNNASSSSQSFPKPISGSPVNRVVGFGNLLSTNATGIKPSTVTGKGNVLGNGNSKANNPRNSWEKNIGKGDNNKGTSNTRISLPGRGFGIGGMLANKGGGTLVLTGSQKKTQSPKKPQSPDTKLRLDKFQVFAGSGQALGGGADRSKSRLLDLKEPENKKRKTEDNFKRESKDFHKQSKDDIEMCKCSVCNQNILREEMGLHLENCSGLLNVFNNSIVEVEDGTENINEKSKETACPICTVMVEGDINAHVDECLNSSGIFNMFDEPAAGDNDNDLIYVQEFKVPKPINELGDDVVIVEQVDEARVVCPLCGMRFGVSRINDHVNQCLDCD